AWRRCAPWSADHRAAREPDDARRGTAADRAPHPQLVWGAARLGSLMDWLTFVASITKSLAWPLVVAWIVFLLRRPLRGVLRSLIRLRYKDLEIDFGRDLEALEREVETARLPAPTEARDRAALRAPADQLEAIAEVSPRAAVLEAWLLVEHEVFRAAERLGVNTAQPLPR